ncbi:hypothetical protein BS47DRAFT_1383900 [Hydnum rufescens UP504]|uniref:Uncharacterized protein n=1 Tax=Hydnum rufescens UP504 TaxID=1448309 RepID=A0A9P6ARD0_9AGAM|nr:hypothetical protein BS47DRAFT_1383900 [Hydnum rufescens UP504]
MVRMAKAKKGDENRLQEASVEASNSHLLKYTNPWTIDLWRQHAFKSQKLVESYELLEIQLFKNEYNVEHEFLIGMFKSPEEVLFIAIERSAQYSNLDHKATANDIIKAMNQGRIQDGGNRSNRSSSSSSRSLGTVPADDMVLVIRGPATFDDAVERFMKRKISRYSRSTSLPRGSMKFATSESNVPSSSPPSSPSDTRAAPPVPNLMHFSYAAIAAHRTRLHYTPTGQNCYWYANAILFILKEKFPPTEPFTVHDTAGTWSFGLFKVSLGSLQRMDYEALIDEYNVCVVEQSGVTKKRTLEQLKEEQQREQRRELERQQLELLIFDAEAKTAEAEARVEAERANAEARVEAERVNAEARVEAERAKAEARVEAAEARIETERAKFEKERTSLEAKIRALELASARGEITFVF